MSANHPSPAPVYHARTRLILAVKGVGGEGLSSGEFSNSSMNVAHPGFTQ
jgi:hypothetical protein